MSASPDGESDGLDGTGGTCHGTCRPRSFDPRGGGVATDPGETRVTIRKVRHVTLRVG